ncbi:GAF domain-containing protein [Pseudoxanthomonas sp. GM95]|uniref:GAF domain-containing protein n=1 Tax=Pseudoxanthomonas sp. GM95 TaxID=1881043 RepID=UPI001C3165C9|nr:GAF domain-containing protein [Pseudoxanthomonas sp. GM95]
MPGVSAPAETRTTLTALLDVTPGIRWQQTFIARAEQFRTEHQLEEVRLIGTHLTVIGNSQRLRTLAPAIQELMSDVSRLCFGGRHAASSPRRADTPAGEDLGMPDVRAQEVALVSRVHNVQDLLAEVGKLTGMRFSAIARVTDTRWTTCAVHDLLAFGLKPGQDLILETTICNDLRQSGQAITFNDATTHPQFSRHHTPVIYGFKSYISVPIVLADGALFGTLCALDPEPAQLDDALIRQIQDMAATVAQQLSALLEAAPIGTLKVLESEN